MKTLKKSLCLILALVFVLGLCTFGAGAAFTDAADIYYEDEVAVMQGLGILKGYEDGSFQPAKTVTRAEAAKMITYMILGEKYSEKLNSAKVFDDVAADHWAAKYINYCASKNIIKGYGDGNYGPNDPVTGLQLAKMLLVACGYGEMGEFGPDNWDVNAFTNAVETGIFEGAETESFEDAATREETALYVFNTLIGVNQMKYDVDQNKYLTYKSPFGVTVWNIDTCVGMVTKNQATGEDYTIVEYTYRVAIYNEDGEIDHYESRVATDNFAAESGAELIGHKVIVYYNTLQKKDADKNYYFNPYLVSDLSTVYSTSNANPFVTKTLGDLAKEMDYNKTDFANVRFFQDGVESGNLKSKTTYFLSAYTLEKDTEITNLSGPTDAAHNYTGTTNVKIANGSSDTASTYIPADALIVDDDGVIISAVKTSYSYAKVTEIDEDEGVVGYEQCTSSFDLDTFTWSFPITSGEALLANCYEGIAEDDFVIVEKYGDVVKLTATTTQTMEVTDLSLFLGFWSTFNGSLYADFNAPTWTNAFVDDDEGTYVYPATAPSIYVPAPVVELGQTVKFFIGKNGQAFAGVVLDTAVSNYVYVVTDYSTEAVSYGVPTVTYKVQAVDGSGNEVNLVTGYVIGETGNQTTVGTPQINLTPGLYKATEQTASNRSYVELEGASTDAKIKTIGSTATNGAVKYNGTESHIKGAPYYMTGSTNYIYVTGSGDELKISKGSALSGTFTGNAYYVADAAAPSVNISTIWVAGAEANVYSGNYVFMKNVTSSATRRIDGKTYHYYGGYVDGVSTTVIDKDEVGGASYNLNGFYSYSVDANGLYSLTSVASSEQKLGVALAPNAVYSGLLMINGVGNDVVLEDADLVDLTSGYQTAKGYTVKISDADTLAEALKLGYSVELSFMYDSSDDAAVGTLYVTRCTK